MSGFDPLESELAEIDRDARTAPRRPALRILPVALAGAAVLGFAIIVWYAYSTGVREGSETAAPLLRPDGPVKVMPENPGGMEVPHQDKTVFNRIDEQGETSPEVERLLPPPEAPRSPPGELTVGPGATPPDSGRVPMPAPPPLPSQDPALADIRRVPVPQQPAPPVRLTPDEPPAAPAPQPPASTQRAPAAATPPAPTPAPAAPAQTASAGAFRIQIGAVKSDAAARQQWQTVTQRNRDVLANVTPIVERADLGQKGIFYRIQGGGFETRAAAQSVCDTLKSRNVGCFVVR